MLKLNVLIILMYALERGAELLVSAHNKKLLIREGEKIEILDKRESLQMKFFHICWLFILLIESNTTGQLQQGLFLYFSVFVLVLAQILRWSAIFTLGKYWSVDVYRMENHPVIEEGPYAYVRHPNYLAVITEFFFLPLLLGSPVTLVLGSIGNLLMLKRRIKMEEEALNGKSGDYDRKFKRKRRFVPLSHG